MKNRLAIDFGTTNSVITCWNDKTNAAEALSLPSISVDAVDGRPPLIPSLLYIQEGQSGQVIVGQGVHEQSLNRRKDNRLFRNFKRGIGVTPAPEARPIDGALWTDRDAGRVFIRHLIEHLPYPATEIEELVLTAPVTAFKGYLDWLNEATDALPTDKIRIVDEATAAALGYAVSQPGAVVMVFDLGGGTLDLSLVELPDSPEKTGGLLQRLLKIDPDRQTARVIAKAGEITGGSDIDQWLLTEVLQRVDLTAQDLGYDYSALLTTCEQGKIALSTAESAPLTFEAAGQTHTVTITRPELETLLAQNGFYTALRQIVDKVMHVSRRQGVFKEDINHVLMVGGVSLMPVVQQVLKQYFGDSVVQADKPFTAVAEGALQLAMGTGLDDYLTHSYGLRYWDAETGGHQYDEIVAMGSRYPIEKPIDVILSPAHPDQTAIEFVFGQIDTGSASMLEMKYEGDQAVFVAQTNPNEEQIIPLNEGEATQIIAPLDPPSPPGEARLKAQFTIDRQRGLHLTVTDLKTGQQILDSQLTLEANEGQRPTSATPASPITGREPHLLTAPGKKGERRLSVRGLATMLNVLPPEAISLMAVTAALENKDFYVRFNAATRLRERGDRDARLVIQETLTHGQGPARASVARQLYGFTWFAAEPLIRQALQDPDLRVREAAIYALCDRRELNAYQLMVETLQNEEDFVRAAATFGLKDCQDSEAVPVLETTMLAEDSEVRVKALDALSVNGTPEAVPVIRQALADPVPYVQYTATMSLLELLEGRCLPELAGVIKQTSGEAREHILRGFFQATNYLKIDVAHSQAAEQVFDALEIAFTDDRPQTRMAVVWPLAWIQHERATTLLRQVYHQEQHSEVKAHMITLTVKLFSPLGKELLEDGLQSQDEQLREAAEQIAAGIAAGSIAAAWETED